MTTFNQRFQAKHGKHKISPTRYTLEKIKRQSPVAYSADGVMPDPSGIRCDSFVVCYCAPSTAGIYVVEEKGASLSVVGVKKQLQSGADFMRDHLIKGDKFDFSPVLVAKSIRSSMNDKLRKVEINLSGKKRRLRRIKPNESLEPIEIVSNARTKNK